MSLEKGLKKKEENDGENHSIKIKESEKWFKKDLFHIFHNNHPQNTYRLIDSSNGFVTLHKYHRFERQIPFADNKDEQTLAKFFQSPADRIARIDPRRLGGVDIRGLFLFLDQSRGQIPSLNELSRRGDDRRTSLLQACGTSSPLLLLRSREREGSGPGRKRERNRLERKSRGEWTRVCERERGAYSDWKIPYIIIRREGRPVRYAEDVCVRACVRVRLLLLRTTRARGRETERKRIEEERWTPCHGPVPRVHRSLRIAAGFRAWDLDFR